MVLTAVVTGRNVHRASRLQAVTSAEKYQAVGTFQLFCIVCGLEEKLLYRSCALQAPSQLIRNGKVL